MANINVVKEALDKVFAQSPGMQWTIRALYYRMVTMKVFANKLSNYKSFDHQIVRLREDGELDDDLFVDNARRMFAGDTSNWELDEFFKSTMDDLKDKWEEYSKSMWEDQDYNVVCVLEKDALVSFVKPITSRYRVALAVGKGYSSRTQILQVVEELVSDRENIILYLGDHDPTGLDIERSLEERVADEAGDDFSVTRVALTYNQATGLNLPPDPTKFQDARSPDYVSRYGNRAWELDAMVGVDPKAFQNRLSRAIEEYINPTKWNRKKDQERRGEEILKDRFEKAYDILRREFPDDDLGSDRDPDEDDEEREDDEGEGDDQ